MLLSLTATFIYAPLTNSIHFSTLNEAKHNIHLFSNTEKKKRKAR